MRVTILLCFLGLLSINIAQTTGVITDTRDGKVYKTVVIGSNTWMAENLNVSTFRNGDPIYEAKTNEDWEKAAKEGKPAWCYYNNDHLNGKEFGKLYNYFALIDSRGLSPEGWHIPSRGEWDVVYWTSCEKLKSQGKYDTKITYKEVEGYEETKWVSCTNCSYWTKKQKENNPCTECKNKGGKTVKTGKYIPKTKKKIEEKILVGGWNGTNETGFSALPGGGRNGDGSFFNNLSQPKNDYSYDMVDLGQTSNWWSSSIILGRDNFTKSIKLIETDSRLLLKESFFGMGLSVRCIKD
jgi:uncharacterized protein (TIGR02145 family)